MYYAAPLHIINVGRYSDMRSIMRIGSSWSFASQAWGTANLARYTPLSIPVRFTVARFMLPNQNTTGNVDVGLYDNSGKRLLSTGTIARANAGAVQYAGVTDQSFPPGNYYLGMVCSSATANAMASSSNSLVNSRIAGLLEEALGSTVLPTTMTPTVNTLSATFFVWGFTQSDTL